MRIKKGDGVFETIKAEDFRALVAKKPKKRGLGEEDRLHQDIAKQLLEIDDVHGWKIAVWWTYSASGEKRTPITGALLKSKGLKSGQPDYHFRAIKNGNVAHNLFIEVKTPTGKQSDSQKLFEETCKKAWNESYYIARSTTEFFNILKEEGLYV